MTAIARSLAVAAALIAGGATVPAAAQVAGNSADAAPVATPTPAIAAPVPAATPTPLATPASAAEEPRPEVAPTRATPPRPFTPRRPTPVPASGATPEPAAAPPPLPVATAAPGLGPTGAATPPPPVLIDPPFAGTAAREPDRYWIAALVAAGLAILTLAWVLLRRRSAAMVEPAAAEVLVEEARGAGTPATPRARLTLGFRPRRAGLNLLSATSENEIVLTNVGDAAADDLRLLVRLFSAHRDQDADLAAFYAEPIGRPSVAAFTLAPGEARTLTVVAALSRDAIRPLTAAGRPMFVPIVGVNSTYRSGEAKGQLAQAFAVGVERVDSAKLAPFWLDAVPRTYDQIAARAHAPALER